MALATQPNGSVVVQTAQAPVLGSSTLTVTGATQKTLSQTTGNLRSSTTTIIN